MKLYQVIEFEKRLTEELIELKNRFIINNSINMIDKRDYNPSVVLEEINEKYIELIRVRYEIQRCNLNIHELVLQNSEYYEMIDLLKSTITSKDQNCLSRVDLDNMIKEYRDKIYKNNETITYYNFITDVDI